MKLRILKTILWFLFGSGLTVIILRIIHGPGSVVALTDILPWGLWKGGGVVALVPIGGAGFTLAAMVYIFRWNRYKPLARGGVLLGLMCYSSVAAGLTFDIGIWWRIVYPVVFWQFHSTLFEIAWCIMLYLGVLVVEFSHAVVERFNWPRVLSVIKKVSVVFVIAGISLSTLHQSSLGTLFLATPYRLHPLWHTDLLPILFFITSIGLGCLTISWAALTTHWFYDAKQPMNAVSGLGRIAAWVLGFYLVLKFAEIFYAGEAGLLLAGTWNTFNFWLEIMLSGLIPVGLLMLKKYRESPTAMFWISTAAILGVSLNRVNVAGLATQTATQSTYFPIWPEWAITIGILSFAALVFLFCVENFKVFDAIDKATVDNAYQSRKVDHADWKTLFFRNPQSELRLYSAIFILAVGLTLGCLPEGSVYGVTPEETPAQAPRVVEVDEDTDALMLDGNRNGDYVLFQHEMHTQKAECAACHHLNKPYEKATRCNQCHKDMYLAVDIFDHELHKRKLGENAGCNKCHTDPEKQKVRESTTACGECHRQMEGKGTLAVGYMDAMHGQCIKCHTERKDQLERPNDNFDRCTHCHRDSPTLDDRHWQSRL